ncbi:unnamed protein product [Trichogramma brassicae]|uniref:Uncharacterized protein n=1 Tax=Trichogramma brassicae TaxID=86971 RepID=A0A6H5J6M0_9HYME|nr:unnamed protein product [Trichogramma brassicae]
MVFCPICVRVYSLSARAAITAGAPATSCELCGSESKAKPISASLIDISAAARDSRSSTNAYIHYCNIRVTFLYPKLHRSRRTRYHHDHRTTSVVACYCARGVEEEANFFHGRSIFRTTEALHITTTTTTNVSAAASARERIVVEEV